MRTLTALFLIAFGAAAAAAVQMTDSPAVGQAQTLLDNVAGDQVYDGNRRVLSRATPTPYDRSMDDQTLPSPGPRVGPAPGGMDEPSDPAPKPAEETKSSGGFMSGLMSNMSWKTVGLAVGGAALGVGLGMLLGWGWLGIAALAVGGLIGGFFLGKMF